MSKTIQLTGLVYNTPTGKVVDYGFEGLYQTSSKTSLETCTLTDNSLCPPLYENIELEPNIDYLAKVVDINEKKCYINIIANGIAGRVHFKHLVQYWGDVECVKRNYAKDTVFTVRFFKKHTRINAFTEKGFRLIPFQDFTYKVGDIIDLHIGLNDEGNLGLWFNGIVFIIPPKVDPIFEIREKNHIYYPGLPIKAEITKIDSPNPDKRIFGFRVLHEKVDYNIQTGYHHCQISEKNRRRYAHIQLEDGKDIRLEIPPAEVPEGFPSAYTTFPATIYVSGFDAIGEPLVQFKSIMQELYNLRNNQSFGIKLIKCINYASKFRIWTGPDGLFGMIARSTLTLLGDIAEGLDGHILNGEFVVTKKGESPSLIKTGQQITATILERTPSYYIVNAQNQHAHVFNISDIDETIESLNVLIVYIDNISNLILCVPIDRPTIKPSKLEVGSKISLPILSRLDDKIIFGDGLHLGIMCIKDWDWCKGHTFSNNHSDSLYISLLIKEISEFGVLTLERRSLINNPWDNISNLIGQSIEVKIESIQDQKVIVSYDNIYTYVKWHKFCQYHSKYGQYLFDIGSKINLYVKFVDIENQILSLENQLESSDNLAVIFDESNDYTAKVFKITPIGIIVEINGVYGIVPSSCMLSEFNYTENLYIDVRFVCSKSFSNKIVYYEFSHKASVIGKTNTILSASLKEKTDKHLIFTANDLNIYCSKYSAKYFSADREEDFADNMVIGQIYQLRITDEQKLWAVPTGMPDYGILKKGQTFNAKILEVLDDGYKIFVDDLKDIFHISFRHYCDWGEFHVETRKVNDTIAVILENYSIAYNRPYFSMRIGQENPWKGLTCGMTITVQNIGSLNKQNDFYVSVNGVPVLLSKKAICSLIGKPWIGNTLNYLSIKPLENIREFTMDILSINIEEHKIDLMPHIEECPKIISHAQVIRAKDSSDCIWVRCENNIIGCLPKDEIPIGYNIQHVLPHAVCKSFNRQDGYAILSVKDLFTDPTIEETQQTDNFELKGIRVTEDTELKENMIVRGIIDNTNLKKKRFSVKVGPYRGLIDFKELSNMYCDVPRYAMIKDQEYDFVVTQIDSERNNLLYLSRKSFTPTPPASITIGENVNAKVVRYDYEDEIIVATIDQYNGVEAYINAADLSGCKIGEKTRFPKIGFHFIAKIHSVKNNQSGTITRIKLYKGE